MKEGLGQTQSTMRRYIEVEEMRDQEIDMTGTFHGQDLIRSVDRRDGIQVYRDDPYHVIYKSSPRDISFDVKDRGRPRSRTGYTRRVEGLISVRKVREKGGE